MKVRPCGGVNEVNPTAQSAPCFRRRSSERSFSMGRPWSSSTTRLTCSAISAPRPPSDASRASRPIDPAAHWTTRATALSDSPTHWIERATGGRREGSRRPPRTGRPPLTGLDGATSGRAGRREPGSPPRPWRTRSSSPGGAWREAARACQRAKGAAPDLPKTTRAGAASRRGGGSGRSSRARSAARRGSPAAGAGGWPRGRRRPREPRGSGGPGTAR